jgi:drug/metabolite transporter (DMT)-like permease
LDLGLSLACGLLTATGFGTADFIAKLTTSKIGFLRTALFMQVIGSFLVLPFALEDTARLVPNHWAMLGGILLGVINAFATLSLYKGFEVGRLSIVSPIASSCPVVSIILAVLFLGESVTEERLLGIGLVIVGVILVSMQTAQEGVSERVNRGTVYAIIYMVLGGLLFFALKPVSNALGVFLPVLIMRWVSIPVLTVTFLAWKTKSKRPTHGAFWFIFSVALFDTFANVIYVVGITVGTVSIVSTVGGMFSAVTVLLARIVLKEKLLRHQILGFAAIAIGVGALGLFG